MNLYFNSHTWLVTKHMRWCRSKGQNVAVWLCAWLVMGAGPGWLWDF